VPTGPMKGCLFFDLDGTLADSGRQIRAAFDEVLADRGLTPLGDSELDAMVGPPMQVSVPALLASRGADPTEAEQVIAAYRQVYREHHLPRTTLNAGVADLLEVLAGRWILAVVTAKPEVQAAIAVEATRTSHHFGVVVGPPMNEVVPKAALLERAITEVRSHHGIELRPDRCWMIGDRSYDIDAATTVGTGSIGVLWGHGTEEELRGAGAHHVVREPSEIVGIVGV